MFTVSMPRTIIQGGSSRVLKMEGDGDVDAEASDHSRAVSGDGPLHSVCESKQLWRFMYSV